MNPRAAWILALGSIAAGCGDDLPLCPVDQPGLQQPYCVTSIVLAIRSSDHLVVQQPEVDFYYELLRPAWLAEPMLRFTQASTRESDPLLGCTVYTTYEPLVSAWMDGEIETGDPQIDRVFRDNGATEVTYLFQNFEGLHLFYVEWELAMNWRLFDAEIATIPETRLEIGHSQPPSEENDIWLSWDGDVAVADFFYAWGDCYTACDGFHRWRARIDPDATVEVEDLGGDPVPDAIRDTAESWPPPL